MDRYEGAEPYTNKEQIIKYLTHNFHCTREEAETAVNDPQVAEILSKAVSNRSYVYYPGDEIAAFNDLDAKDDD